VLEVRYVTNLLGICKWEACSCTLRAAARQTCGLGAGLCLNANVLLLISVSGRLVCVVSEQTHGRPVAEVGIKSV